MGYDFKRQKNTLKNFMAEKVVRPWPDRRLQPCQAGVNRVSNRCSRRLGHVTERDVTWCAGAPAVRLRGRGTTGRQAGGAPLQLGAFPAGQH